MSSAFNILIVDDNEIMRSMIIRTLTDIPCTFSEAIYGGDALTLIQKNKFELIILDLKLPDMTGLEVFERAKQIEPKLGEVIFLTGYPDDKTYKRARLLGAYAYLSKAPYDVEALRRTIKMALKLEITDDGVSDSAIII
jgi:CheY-like chemotaxis protein